MPDLSDPIAAFRAAVDILNAERWAEAADVVDPVSLRVFARGLIGRIAPDTPQHALSADDYMKSDPNLPRHVAEHYVEQRRREMDPMVRLKQMLPTVDSLEALRALSPRELLAAWMDDHSMRRRIERLAANGQISAEAADLRNAIGFATYGFVAIGAVMDGADIAHVLYRRDSDPSQPWSGDAAAWLAERPEDEQRLARDLWAYGHPSVALMRRQEDGTWRLVIEHDFLAMGNFFIAGVEARKES